MVAPAEEVQSPVSNTRRGNEAFIVFALFGGLNGRLFFFIVKYGRPWFRRFCLSESWHPKRSMSSDRHRQDHIKNKLMV